MCGRYVVAYDPQTLVAGFSVTRVQPFPRRWNVTPQSPVPVIYQTRDGERVAELMRWGLLPHWARDPKAGQRLNNARAETAADKPSFRQALRRRRCLLPASGYYEWQATAAGKQPWFISPTADADPPVFAMAGLFEAWRAQGAGADDPWLLTCCILTRAPNALTAPIHDRMPVIVAREQWAGWLDRQQQEAEPLGAVLEAPPVVPMRAWPVSRALDRRGADEESLIEPLALAG